MVRPERKRPRERVKKWPDVASDEPSVEVARRLSLTLSAVLRKRGDTLRAAQTATGVNYTSIGDIVRGATWPDLETVARLEAGLGVDLWPAGVARQVAVRGASTPGADESTGGTF